MSHQIIHILPALRLKIMEASWDWEHERKKPRQLYCKTINILAIKKHNEMFRFDLQRN
jgi:hypothetical protein